MLTEKVQVMAIQTGDEYLVMHLQNPPPYLNEA